jgi:hypothetical protein
VADDAAMQITEAVRGCDLLQPAAAVGVRARKVAVAVRGTGDDGDVMLLDRKSVV